MKTTHTLNKEELIQAAREYIMNHSRSLGSESELRYGNIHTFEGDDPDADDAACNRQYICDDTSMTMTFEYEESLPTS